MEEGYLALRWNNHNNAFKNVLQLLREQGMYTDVSLACGKRLFHVHKFVLSTCSESFREIFSQLTYKQHTVVYMKDVLPKDLECILDFMYRGEVHISRNELGSLLRTAESLQVKGLAVPDELLPANEQISSPPKPKATSSSSIPTPSASSKKNSVPKSSKRPAPSETTPKTKENMSKRFKSEPLKNIPAAMPVPKAFNLDTIIAASPSLTEDADLAEIKKELASEYGGIFQEDTIAATNGFENEESHSSDHYGEYFKSEYMDENYDNSNLSYENSDISTSELLQVDLNEGGENFFIRDAALRETAQALDGNTEVSRKPFVCTLCPNTFTRRDNLTNHVKTHMGERPYMCEYCKKCFTRKDYLKQHERIHTGEKPFQCPTCTRAFTRKEGLTDHMRCHSDLKEFACDICGREFKQKCGLRFHKRNYHQ